MQNILVPTDFSYASRNSTKYAVSLAQPFNAKLTLVNVVTPPVIVDDSILASIMITQAEILEANREKIETEIGALSKKYSIEIKGFVREGFALDQIRKMAKSKRSDVIVMGMKGKGQSKSVFGSTTTSVIRELDFPVFVIPQNAVFKPIDNITFASDFDADISKHFTLEELSDPWVRLRPKTMASCFHIRFFETTPKRMFEPERVELPSRGSGA